MLVCTRRSWQLPWLFFIIVYNHFPLSLSLSLSLFWRVAAHVWGAAEDLSAVITITAVAFYVFFTMWIIRASMRFSGAPSAQFICV